MVLNITLGGEKWHVFLYPILSEHNGSPPPTSLSLSAEIES